MMLPLHTITIDGGEGATISVECPGLDAGGCRGWAECGEPDCLVMEQDFDDDVPEVITAHGVEHSLGEDGYVVESGCLLENRAATLPHTLAELVDYIPGIYHVRVLDSEASWYEIAETPYALLRNADGTVDEIAFRVNGIPKPKGSLRPVSRGKRTALIEQVKGSPEWRAVVSFAARRAMLRADAAPFAGAVGVHGIVYLPRPKTVTEPYPISQHSGDDDKHARNILDALADGGVYADDCLVVDLVIRKRYADGVDPGAVIRVEKIYPTTPTRKD